MNRYYKIFTFIILSFALCIDTDGDGYSDKVELELGTNPKDSSDKYYLGSWPYNSNKEIIKGIDFPILCPNNVSCECELNKDCINQKTNTFKEKSELIKIFIQNNVDITKPIVFTCGSGMTACVLGMAYYIISDKNAVIYDGSWSEYGII